MRNIVNEGIRLSITAGRIESLRVWCSNRNPDHRIGTPREYADVKVTSPQTTVGCLGRRRVPRAFDSDDEMEAMTPANPFISSVASTPRERYVWPPPEFCLLLRRVLLRDAKAMFELLVENGVSVERVINDKGERPIHVACLSGGVRILKFLRRRKANLKVMKKV